MGANQPNIVLVQDGIRHLTLIALLKYHLQRLPPPIGSRVHDEIAL